MLCIENKRDYDIHLYLNVSFFKEGAYVDLIDDQFIHLIDVKM